MSEQGRPQCLAELNDSGEFRTGGACRHEPVVVGPRVEVIGGAQSVSPGLQVERAAKERTSSKSPVACGPSVAPIAAV